jgi:hypothetical protein
MGFTLLDVLPYLVVLLAVGVLATVLLRRRRRNTWKVFARKYGFGFKPGPPATVEGQVQGRNFRLFTSGSSSDTGLLGVEVVGMSLAPLSAVPEDMEVVNAAASRAAERPGYQAVRTGDEPFDDKAAVLAVDPERANNFLTARRRAALLELVGFPGALFAGLRDRQLMLTERRIVSDLDNLEKRFHLLLRVMRELQ